jgi:hypothetical protein
MGDDSKAFDAAEAYLREEGSEPCPESRTVSLVTGLRALLSRSPGPGEKVALADRARLIRQCSGELTRRGLDGPSLIRYGLAEEVLGPLIAALLLQAAFGAGDAVEGIAAASWCTALGIETPGPRFPWPTAEEASKRFEELVVPAIPRLLRWVCWASLDEIISLKSPDAGRLGGSRDAEVAEQYRWLVDHFSSTYYHQWETSSLHCGLRLLDGDLLPPCAASLMEDRCVDRGGLLEEIAKRAVYRTSQEPTVVYASSYPALEESVKDEVTRQALLMLHEGRHLEAAAVFEFGTRQLPDDADVRNNLGFCLIPVDPVQALRHLEKASGMGYRPAVTNAYNMMCCLIATGRPDDALVVASRVWTAVSADQERALLWERCDDTNWQLLLTDDAAAEVALLAGQAARAAGLLDQANVWRRRSADRRPSAA